MSKKDALAVTVGAVAFGVIMSLRSQFESVGMRAAAAGLAFVILASLVRFGRIAAKK